MADIDVLGIKFELRGIEDGVRNLEKMDKITDEVQATLKALKKQMEEIGKTSSTSYKEQIDAVAKLAQAKKLLEEANKQQAAAELNRAKARKQEASIDQQAMDAKLRREGAYSAQLDAKEKREQSLANLRKKEAQIDEDIAKKQIANTTARLKQKEVEANIEQKALDAKVRRENAYAKAVDDAAKREQTLAKEKAQTAAAEELANERKQKALHWEQKRLDASSLFAAQEARLSNQSVVALDRLNTYKLNQMSMIETRQLKANASIEQGAARLALQQEKFELQKQRAAERAAQGSVSAWSKFKDVMSTISDVTIGGFGISAIVEKLSGVVKTADEMVLLDSRLKLATKSTEEFRQAQNNLRQSSVNAGLSLSAQTANYTQLERSTRSMGLSVSQLAFLTESFGKAAVVSGADAESFKSAITQLNQGFASGVIRGQEFNSVAEQAPAVLEALAAGLRGNNKEFDALEKKGLLGVAALRKIASEGKLVNSVTLPALMEGLKKTNAEFEKMPLTVERAFTMLSNKYKIWISDQNTASGATAALANSIKSLATNFESIVSVAATSATILATVIGGRLVSSFVAARTESVTSFIASAKAAKQAELGAVLWAETTERGVESAKRQLDAVSKIPGNITAVEKATKALAVAENTHTSAIEKKNIAMQEAASKTTLAGNASRGFGVILGALGGPVGIAITALGLIISYWDDITESIEKAIKSQKYFLGLKADDFAGTGASTVIADADAAIRKAEQDRAILRANKAKGIVPLSVSMGSTDSADYSRRVKAYYDKEEQKLNEMIRAATDAKKKADEAREQARADFRKSEIDSWNTSPIKVTDVVTEDKKKGKLPDETLGMDAALRNLERSLSMKQSAVEQEKQLVGYSSETTLEELKKLEVQRLSLQQQQEAQRLSEESKKKMTAEAAAQHKLAVQQRAQQIQTEKDELSNMQKRRDLLNAEAKTKVEITEANKVDVKNAQAAYKLAQDTTKAEIASLEYAETMGDVRTSVAALSKSELASALEIKKAQTELVKLKADEKLANAQTLLTEQQKKLLGKEEVDRRQEAAEAAKDAVKSKEQEIEAIKQVIAKEKEVAAIRQNGLIGAKKAINDYLDGLDNWYETGYNVAKESVSLLEDAFVSFIETGKLSGAKLFKYLRDEFKKLAVQRIIIQPIIQPIMNGATSLINSAMSGAANGAGILGSLSSVGSTIIGAGKSLATGAFGAAESFATSGVGQWLGLSESTAEIGTVMTEAGNTFANFADKANTYLGYAKAAYDVFNAFKEGKGWGAAAGSAIGAFSPLGGLGAAIGGTVGGFVDKAFGGGGGQKVGGEGAVGMSNMGLFPEGQTDSAVQQSLVEFNTSLKDVAKKFGVSLDNIAVAYGYETDPQGSAGNFFSSKATLNGASIREVTVQKYEGEVVDQMAKEFKTITVLALSGAGLKEDFQAAFKDFDVKNVTEESVNKVLARLDAIAVVLDAFDKLSQVFPYLSNLSIEAKESIIGLAGGLEALTSKLDFYFQNFYSQEEQLATKTSILSKEFEKIGLTMPTTREGFRALVEAQDKTTESGQKAYVALLDMANAFAEITPAAQEVAAASNEAAKAAEALAKKQRIAEREREAAIKEERAKAFEDLDIDKFIKLSKVALPELVAVAGKFALKLNDSFLTLVDNGRKASDVISDIGDKLLDGLSAKFDAIDGWVVDTVLKDKLTTLYGQDFNGAGPAYMRPDSTDNKTFTGGDSSILKLLENRFGWMKGFTKVDTALVMQNITQNLDYTYFGTMQKKNEELAKAYTRVLNAQKEMADDLFQSISGYVTKLNDVTSAQADSVNQLYKWKLAFENVATMFSQRYVGLASTAQLVGKAAKDFIDIVGAGQTAEIESGLKVKGVGKAADPLAEILSGIKQDDAESLYNAFLRLSDALGSAKISADDYNTAVAYARDIYTGAAEAQNALAESLRPTNDNLFASAYEKAKGYYTYATQAFSTDRASTTDVSEVYTLNRSLGLNKDSATIVRLTDELNALKGIMVQIATNTKLTADQQRRWDINGMPTVRTE